MPAIDSRLRLSRYIQLRPTRHGMALESALSGAAVLLKTDAALRLLLAFLRPRRVDDVLARIAEPQRPVAGSFVRWCCERQFLTCLRDGDADLEEQDGLAHWAFHDLIYHVSSRRGRNAAPAGATYHLRGVIRPEPTLKEPPSGARVALERPDIDALRRQDVPLTWALEERRTIRSMDPLDLTSLGCFLYRTSRVTRIVELPGEDRYARKVYPSGGSLHSLEVYVIAASCCGLERAVYHYDAHQHALTLGAPFDADAEALLREAQAGMGGLPTYPPVLLVVTSRFRRVMWKYESIAYHAILQEVGALYQTMYLVATAMGLAPCAIGAGDSDRFARLIKSDYYRETSVGEFALGAIGARS